MQCSTPAMHADAHGHCVCAHSFQYTCIFLATFTGMWQEAYSRCAAPQSLLQELTFIETGSFSFEELSMSFRLLAVLPFIGILLGVPFVNRVEPLVLGMPFVLAWIVMWVVLSSIIMGIIYRLDPVNRQASPGEEVRS